MGMELKLEQITPTQLEEFLESTEKAFEWIEGGMFLDPVMDEAIDTDEDVTERKQFDLDKNWHVLHYALNGTSESGDTPLSQAVLGNREIPDDEGVMVYGPVRYLRPEEVMAAAKALEAVDPQQLTSKWDSEDAKKKSIYGARAFDDPHTRGYLPELFEEFSAFYRDAAERGSALLMELCI